MGLLIRFTVKNNEAQIIKVFGDSTCVDLPDTLNGIRVTSIGKYAFAKTKKILTYDQSVQEIVSGEEPEEKLELGGREIVSVRLPLFVHTLESACFYDCRNLKQITVGPHIRSLGSDLFTNCGKLTELIVESEPEHSRGIQRLLGILQNDMRVSFLKDGKTDTVLHFPEYWEELEENAPAHIFNMGIHGQGYRYRQCFAGDAPDLNAYDAAFHPSLAEGNHVILGLLALDRLRYPTGLKEERHLEYRDFLQKEGLPAAKLLVDRDDSECISFLCDLNVLEQSDINKLMEYCRLKEKAKILALLTQYQHSAFGKAKKIYSFDF